MGVGGPASISSLPLELLCKITSYLHLDDLCHCVQVCRLWADVSSHHLSHVEVQSGDEFNVLVNKTRCLQDYVKSLEIKKNCLSHATKLSNVLDELPHLKGLNIEYNELCEISHLPPLEMFELIHYSVSRRDKIPSHILHSLSDTSYPTLTHLSFTSVDLSSEKRALKLIANSFPGLVKLRLCICELSPEDINLGGQYLSQLHELQELVLKETRLTLTNEILLTLLREAVNLSHLHIDNHSFNQVPTFTSGATSHGLAAALCHADNLEQLRLDWIDLSPDVMGAISRLPKLSTFCVFCHKATPSSDGFSKLGQSLSLQKLKVHSWPLDLNFNISIPNLTSLEISYFGGTTVEDVIRISPQLKFLKIQTQPGLRDDDLRLLCGLSRLTQLNIDGCKGVSGEGVKSLVLLSPSLKQVDAKWIRTITDTIFVELDNLDRETHMVIDLKGCGVTKEKYPQVDKHGRPVWVASRSLYIKG